MRKTKLRTYQEFDFKLWGIISNAKGYRLAWEINQIFNINLLKRPDINIDFINQDNLSITNFKYEKENSKLILLTNKDQRNQSMTTYLLPELHRFDYLFWVKTYDAFDIIDLMNKMKKSSVVQYLIQLDLGKLKSRENLLF